MTSEQELIKGLPGYKIGGSHFKIGTKIHISDFYYAKRFFQNSFFASRFAYLLAADLEKTLSTSEMADLRSQGLTLIGYGIYSELLLSLTEKFIKKKLGIGDAIVNHNVLLDTSDLEFAKKPVFHRNILLVVPIASTFSTSLKMEATVRELVKLSENPPKILPYHYNLIHVSPFNDELKPNAEESEFGWKAKDPANKQITVNAFFEKAPNKRYQKYFLRLKASWHEVENCQLCYEDMDNTDPEKEEKPLMETDQTAVTPALIFGYPISNNSKPRVNPYRFELLPDMVQYGHHMRDQSHFLYLIDTESFLRKNMETVRKWLRELTKTPEFSENLSQFQNILIISSCHYSNAEFINTVNEIMFSSSANVIHYDPKNDYIQNFDMIYGHEISTADKIVFVDDALKSGKTFQKIDEFARYTLKVRKENNQSVKGKEKIDACIFLINKSQPYTLKSIGASISQADSIFCFADLNLYTSLSHDESSPLLLETEKQNQLIKYSVLDSIRSHFIYQKRKLSTTVQDESNLLTTERHIMMLEATHRIYQYFGNPKIEFKLDNFHEFSLHLQETTKFLSDYEFRCSSISEGGLTMFHSCLLKVLTQSPFTQYEPIKRVVFKWVKQLLKAQMKTVSNAINTNTFTYAAFNDLKFLIRRATLLNSNILLNKPVLEMIANLYVNDGIPSIRTVAKREVASIEKIIRENNNTTDPDYIKAKFDLPIKKFAVKNIENFDIFFTAQIKELLFLNEARAPRLEQVIRPRSTSELPAYDQLASMLQIENAVIIQSFYEFLISDPELKEKLEDDTVTKEILDKEYILKLLKTPRISKHQKYKVLTSYFSKSGQLRPLKNDNFISYIWIKFYIAKQNLLPDSLMDKTKAIFDEISGICLSPIPDDEVLKLGCCLVIKDKLGTPVPVYDVNGSAHAELNHYRLQNPDDVLISDLLDVSINREPFYHHTILGLVRESESNIWINPQATDPAERKVKLKKEFLKEDINRLILVKLTSKNLSDSRSNGFAAFYFQSSGKSSYDVVRIQYLMLLQDSLNTFVEQNHKNNLFREWLKAEHRKRFVLLTGHNREMMQTIMNNEKKLRDIALDFEHMQNLVMVNDNLTYVGGQPNLELKFETFYTDNNRSVIDNSYLTWLGEIADTIYKSENIENFSDPDIQIEEAAKEPFSFLANKRVLNIICFELLLNAKKNRWHFMDDDNIMPVPKNKVRLSITAKEEKGEKTICIIIRNTSCNVDSEQTDEGNPVKLLNSGIENIKKDYATSGTALIRELVTELLKGDIKYSCDQDKENPELYLFSVAITFKEQHNNASFREQHTTTKENNDH